MSPGCANKQGMVWLVLATVALTGACSGYELDPYPFGGGEEAPQEGAGGNKAADPREQLAQVIIKAGDQVETYLGKQAPAPKESVHRLTPDLYPGLFQHFPADLLAEVSLVVREDLPVPQLADAGIDESVLNALGIDFKRQHKDTLAITHDKTIYVRPAVFAAKREDVLFHEMVHVVQYQYLGRQMFLRWYVYFEMQGKDNPLETMAYGLEAGFVKKQVPSDLSAHIYRETEKARPHL